MNKYLDELIKLIKNDTPHGGECSGEPRLRPNTSLPSFQTSPPLYIGSMMQEDLYRIQEDEARFRATWEWQG